MRFLLTELQDGAIVMTNGSKVSSRPLTPRSALNSQKALSTRRQRAMALSGLSPKLVSNSGSTKQQQVGR